MRRSTALIVLLGMAALVGGWFASGVRTFTRPAEVLTAIPVLAVLLLTLRPAARKAAVAGRSAYRGHGLTAWFVLLLAVVDWELTMLFSKPRKAHPTLSSILNSLLSTHPSRFLGIPALAHVRVAART